MFNAFYSPDLSSYYYSDYEFHLSHYSAPIRIRLQVLRIEEASFDILKEMKVNSKFMPQHTCGYFNCCGSKTSTFFTKGLKSHPVKLKANTCTTHDNFNHYHD